MKEANSAAYPLHGKSAGLPLFSLQPSPCLLALPQMTHCCKKTVLEEEVCKGAVFNNFYCYNTYCFVFF